MTRLWNLLIPVFALTVIPLTVPACVAGGGTGTDEATWIEWYNHRIQDADIGYVPELGRYVMTCNMMDTDGNPGGSFPGVREGGTRVIGVFYSRRETTGEH